MRGLYLFGRWFGTIEYLINFRRRRRYRQVLRQVFPEPLTDARERKIIRDYFLRTRCDKLYYLIFDRLPREKIMRRIRFLGRQHVDAALERGQGVYVMLSHHGSHHVAGLLMALLGYKCAGVRDRNEGAIRMFVQQRYAETFPEYAAVRMLYADSFPRDIYRCFQENRVVGSALDVNRDRGPGLKTCPVRVFDETREFLTGTLPDRPALPFDDLPGIRRFAAEFLLSPDCATPLLRPRRHFPRRRSGIGASADAALCRRHRGAHARAS